ncbi:MFS transporter [Paradesulfitobacterium ferrireducens]|uniref:MFS transporter n=1 Tax=Paradesulfitobacterium ferrireducens TaxID=2816476 RepID=UPI001A8FDD73|nr:MFS transporter [Paradesulfitobacterium ferrireducens]
MKLKGPWIALQHRNYRLLWFGNTFSQLGDHMQQVAQNWLVWQITGSVTALGLAAFIGIIPRLAFGFFGGPIVDKYNRRYLLGSTQSAALLFSLGFALTAASGAITFPLALFFIFTLETTQIINQTTRQALLQEIVPRQDIPSAVSLNGTGNNLARIAGPALGGTLIPVTGVEGLMFLNSLTFLGVLMAVWRMRIPARQWGQTQAEEGGFCERLLEGYRYIWKNNRLRMLIYLGMVSAFLIMPIISMLPAYVDNVLKGGPQTFGFLMAAFGIGAVLGAMNGPAVRASIGGVVTLLAAVLQGILFILLGAITIPFLAFGLMFTLGLATITYNNSVVTAMQLSTAPEYLGRVMGIYLMHKAVTAAGAMLLGTVATFAGADRALVISGIFYLGLGAGVQYANRDLQAQALSAAVPGKGKGNG